MSIIRIMTYVQLRTYYIPRLLEKEEFKCFVLCRGICISFHIFLLSLLACCADVFVWKTGNHIYAHAHRDSRKKRSTHTYTHTHHVHRTSRETESWQLDSSIKYIYVRTAPIGSCKISLLFYALVSLYYRLFIYNFFFLKIYYD